jgi:hypothetical protein
MTGVVNVRMSARTNAQTSAQTSAAMNAALSVVRVAATHPGQNVHHALKRPAAPRHRCKPLPTPHPVPKALLLPTVNVMVVAAAAVVAVTAVRRALTHLPQLKAAN